MTQQTRECPCCGKRLAQGKYDVCFSDECCTEYPLHDRACYRYFLRATSPHPSGKGSCLFLMLNPSKADEKQLDRTISRCKEFVERWGYEALWVSNLYAFRSPKQEALRSKAHPVEGPANDEHVREAVRQADKVVLAWGSNVKRARVREVLSILSNELEGVGKYLYVLGSLTSNGQPRHPLPRDNSLPVETTQCNRVRIGRDGSLALAD